MRVICIMTDVYNGIKSCDQAMLDFTLGTLSPARQAIMLCQREISGDIDTEINFQETVAASLMMQDEGEALSADFFDRFNENITDYDVKIETCSKDVADMGNEAQPHILRRLCGRPLSELKWKSLAPGVEIYDIMEGRGSNEDERLYLLRAKGGKKLPEHSHNGEEWTLIIQGGYEAGGEGYVSGDLHISDDDVSHAPHIDAGEDCICLVMTEGPLKMKSLLPRLLQPLIGI